MLKVEEDDFSYISRSLSLRPVPTHLVVIECPLLVVRLLRPLLRSQEDVLVSREHRDDSQHLWVSIINSVPSNGGLNSINSSLVRFIV